MIESEDRDVAEFEAGLAVGRANQCPLTAPTGAAARRYWLAGFTAGRSDLTEPGEPVATR